MRQATTSFRDRLKNREQRKVFLRRPFRMMLTIGAVLTLLVMATVPALASPLGVQDDPDSTLREDDRSDARVDIALENGNQLSFVPMYGEHGKLEGYGVVEKIAPGGQEVARMREFRELNPVELMQALSAPESKIPQDLVDLYGQPSRGDRGWGLALVPGPVNGPDGIDVASCYLPSTFDDDFPGYQQQFITLNDGPATVPSHWLPAATPGDYYTWGRVYNVRQYYTKVTRCNVDEHQFIWGPTVSVSYRNNQNYPAWGVAFYPLGELEEFGSSVSFTWHPPAPSSLYDFQVFVNNVLYDDTFHIGIEWSKAFGIKSN